MIAIYIIFKLFLLFMIAIYIIILFFLNIFFVN